MAAVVWSARHLGLSELRYARIAPFVLKFLFCYSFMSAGPVLAGFTSRLLSSMYLLLPWSCLTKMSILRPKLWLWLASYRATFRRWIDFVQALVVSPLTLISKKKSYPQTKKKKIQGYAYSVSLMLVMLLNILLRMVIKRCKTVATVSLLL